MGSSYQSIVGSLGCGGFIRGRVRLRVRINRETEEYVEIALAVDSDELEALIAFIVYALRDRVGAESFLSGVRQEGHNITFFSPPRQRVEDVLRRRPSYRDAGSALMAFSRQLEACELLVRGEHGTVVSADLSRVAPPEWPLDLDLSDWSFRHLLTRLMTSLPNPFIGLKSKSQDVFPIAGFPLQALIARAESIETTAQDELPDDLPDALECPITLMPIIDPVSCTPDGHPYEREALETHFKANGRFDPYTRADVGTLHERPDIAQRLREMKPAEQRYDVTSRSMYYKI